MFGFGESEDAYQQVYQQGGGYEEPEKHEGHFSHELVGGAAAFEGMKLFEDQQRKEGKTVSHGFAKELLAGFAGGEVEKLAETRGMDEVDKVRAKRHAEESAHNMYDQHYGDQDNYDPSQMDRPNRFNNY